MDTCDILVEKDPDTGRFLLTGKTDRGRDWLDGIATASSQWWGKSLIVTRWEVDGVIDAAVVDKLEVITS